ncbi:MAG TPA: SDR family oxidoreductase [Gammaproteobacteria bacterium]|nr:SDR family oxidoreductase [Gammaproteobacteria bacterium]
MNLDLQHKHALVCGASQGIGRATAMTLARMGTRVTLLARNTDNLQIVCAELATRHGQQHDYISADLDQPEKLKDQLAKLDTVHILVNNAGGPPGGPIHNANTDAFEAGMRRHLLANQTLVQQVLPGMREAGFGRIINIISTSVKEPIPGLGVSNTVRWAVAGWAKTLARELAPDHITVNNVLPGFTDTERLSSLFSGKAEKTGKSAEQVRDEALAQVPMGRFANPQEIANGIAFLASPAAAYITGINLPVDGGRLHSL